MNGINEKEIPENENPPIYRELTLPLCTCDSKDFKIDTTRRDAWGKTRYCRCRDCGQHIVITVQ